VCLSFALIFLLFLPLFLLLSLQPPAAWPKAHPSAFNAPGGLHHTHTEGHRYVEDDMLTVLGDGAGATDVTIGM